MRQGVPISGLVVSGFPPDFSQVYLTLLVHRYLPERGDLVCASTGCSAGDEMSRFNWGSADSGPWVVDDRVCTEKEGGYTAC